MAREDYGDMIVTEPTLLADEHLPANNDGDNDDCSSVEGEIIQPQIDGNFLSYAFLHYTFTRALVLTPDVLRFCLSTLIFLLH